MKEQLRYKYKIKRKYFQHSIRDVADGAIKDACLQLFEDKQSFLVYYSFGSEADTHSLIADLLSAGKRVYLPRVENSDIVAVPFDGDDKKLVKSSMGICEPTGQAYFGQIDVAIIPLLAINFKGFRLGYGGGFYDRFLKDKKLVKAGIGYSLQITDEFVGDEWDVPLDYFICEKGVYTFERTR